MLVKLRRSLRDNTPRLVIFILFILFMLAYLSPRIFVTIPAGHEGVLYRRLLGGTDVSHVYEEGLKLFFPWDTLTPYNLREQILTVDMNALTADGLNVKVTVTIRFQPKARIIGTLHKEHGPNYIKSFLAPEVESASRYVLGGSKPVELYSRARTHIESEISRHLQHELRQYEEFFAGYWPHPEPGQTYEGEVANKVDDHPNVRIILKHFYEHEEEDSELAQRVRKVGFVHLFRQMHEQETQFEQAKIFFRRELDRLAGEIITANRKVATHHIYGDDYDDATPALPGSDANGTASSTRAVEQALELYSRARTHIDSLNAAKGKLVQQKVEMIQQQQAHTADFKVLQKSYDRFFKIIELKDVLISDIVLPPDIKAAIESKLGQEQVAEEFDFRIERERKEAERKRIEARGIRDFQDMVAIGVEEGLLKWKAIEATLELARSPNAKIIIIGAGEGGLPVILGNQGWEDSTPMPRDTLSLSESVAPVTSPLAP